MPPQLTQIAFWVVSGGILGILFCGLVRMLHDWRRKGKTMSLTDEEIGALESVHEEALRIGTSAIALVAKVTPDGISTETRCLGRLAGDRFTTGWISEAHGLLRSDLDRAVEDREDKPKWTVQAYVVGDQRHETQLAMVLRRKLGILKPKGKE